MSKKMNGLAVVAVSFGTWENANGVKKTGMFLAPLAGPIPSKRIIAQQVAENMMLTSGNAYLMSFTEGEVDDEYGRQFNWACAGRVQPLELIEFVKALGTPAIVPIEDVPAAGTGGATKANETLKPVANEVKK